MKRLLLSAAALAAIAPLPAHALTIGIDAETLRDANGGLFPTSGLVLLSAATQGIFTGPSADRFATGSEMIVARWDLSTWGTAGALSDFVAGLNFNGDWDTGDPLRLYWFPTLTLASTEPGAGTPFGSYSDLVGIGGSDAWITPGEGDTVNLRFATTDAAALLLPGSLSLSAGLASESTTSVVPEPGTASFGAALLLTLARRRRRG